VKDFILARDAESHVVVVLVAVGESTAGMTAEELTNAIMNAPVTRCDEAAWRFLGISLAGYNALISLALAAVAAWGAKAAYSAR